MRHMRVLLGGLLVFLSVGLYAGDYTWDGSAPISGNYYADATNTLDVSGDITIDGDVTISNTEGSLGNCHTFEVNVTADAFLHPAYDSSEGYGHLVFYTDEYSRIKFNVTNDLIFTGSNRGHRDVRNRELTMTFSGQGQVLFHIATSKQVGFEGLFSDGGGASWTNYYDDYTKTGSGVMAYITMDQTYEQAIEQGCNKVVFQRNFEFDAEDAVNTSTRDSVKITVGKNSFITYISNILSGVSEELGYGSMAFDPSCYGPGRMLLHLKGSGIIKSDGTGEGLTGAYNDGAVVVAGHYVNDYTTTTGILTGVELNTPAGVEAIFRIIDEQAFANSKYAGEGELYKNSYGEPVLSDNNKPSRRGLLVINENKSYPSLAADTYVNNNWYNEYVFKTAALGTTSIRPGFILGINGSMELFHNTFLDYVAASTMFVSPYEKDLFDQEYSTTVVKKKNPSAFIVDGLSTLGVDRFNPANPYESSTQLYTYNADVAECGGGRHAQILLRGDARLYFRSGVWSNGYFDAGPTFTTAGSLGGYLSSDGLDRLYSFTINFGSLEGKYDGTDLVGVAAADRFTYGTIGEGNHAIDVEGKLTIRSTSDENQTNESGFVTHKRNIKAVPDPETYCFCRHYRTRDAARGALNLPPIKLDYMGQEIKNDILNRVVRPLTVNEIYPCYNSSSIFANAEISMHNLHWHHNDLLKIASPEQDKAEPAVVGGEKATLHYAYWSTVNTGTGNTLFVENPLENINTKVPLISMFTTTLHCHESFVASGVRFVVTDKFWYDTDDTAGHPKLVSNVSTIMCYNHGDQLDMLKRGYGRTFMLGSQQNKMADGIYLNDYTQNAYLNVYRTWHTRGNDIKWGDGDYLVRLSLETDAQPKYTIQYETRDDTPVGVFSNIVDDGLFRYKRVATQVFYLGNGSYASLGWTTTMGDQVVSLDDMWLRANDVGYSYSYGINEGLRPRPWDMAWGLTHRYDADCETIIAPAEFKFSLTTEANDPAEVFVNGDCYYFGGRDASGNVAIEPIVASNESCVWYINHGGKFHINQLDKSIDQGHYFDCYVDTVLAYREWPRIYSTKQSAYIDGLAGVVDLPHDQVKFGRSIQPYELNFINMYVTDNQTKERNIRLSVYDEKKYGVSPTPRDKASGEEVTLGWNFRTDKSVRISYMEPSPTFTPVKTPSFMSDDIASIFKSTTPANDGSVGGPAVMPEVLLTVSTGDVIKQLRVTGATKADPLHLYITGGHQGYGVVREITSLESNYFNPGEGCHAAIFIDGGGHLGLGTADWNKHSNNAWSVLGYDYVTLYPNGNAFIWVNSNLTIADRLPIIPTTSFGSYGNDKQVLTHAEEDQRITFYSPNPVEIRIPEGGELDLSAFGNPTGTASGSFAQQIEFAGKVKLILECGARIRFPSDPTMQPVLYFNDESELIFEGTEDRDREIWTDYTGSDELRTKILGKGQIWLNKSAKLKILDTSLVGVETDAVTPNTDVTISVARQGEMQLGNANVSGGGFQVGNPVSRGGTINFDLVLRDPESRFTLRREGFFGLGVGVVNKDSAPNGNWRVMGLYDVDTVTIDIQEGIFDHNQIFDGDNRNASIMAIGPASTYNFSVGDPAVAIVKGGGNILRVVTAGEVYPNLAGGIPPYSSATFGSLAGSVAGAGTTTGDHQVLSPRSVLSQVGLTFSGSASGFFAYLAFPDLATFSDTNGTYVAFGTLYEEQRIGHVVGTTITRVGNPTISDTSNLETSLNFGELKSSVHPATNLPVDLTGVS